MSKLRQIDGDLPAKRGPHVNPERQETFYVQA
jgi:hypothetical protein